MAKLNGKRSEFPKKTDEIIELLNPTASTRKKIGEYQSLSDKGNLTSQERERFNALTKELEEYIFDVEKWNKFGDILVNMQNFFKTGVEPYVDDRIKHFDSEISKFNYKGEWNEETQYTKNNTVYWNGEGYIALKDNKKIFPNDSSTWGKIVEKGEKGDTGISVTYKGDFNKSTLYNVGDGVTYQGFWYYAKQDTKGVLPTDKEYWELQHNQVYIGEEKPDETRVLMWIDTRED